MPTLVHLGRTTMLAMPKALNSVLRVLLDTSVHRMAWSCHLASAVKDGTVYLEPPCRLRWTCFKETSVLWDSTVLQALAILTCVPLASFAPPQDYQNQTATALLATFAHRALLAPCLQAVNVLRVTTAPWGAPIH